MPLFILFFSLWLAGFSTNVFATDITVEVDRNPVSVDETFQITFTANESPDDDPDFSPLEQDFTIQNESKSSQMTLINGKSNYITQWVETVTAKDSGNTTIPIIKFGKDLSRATPIKILPSSDNKTIQNDDNLFLKVEVNTKKPFVQSQVLYTVKLYRRVSWTNASLKEPELNDAVIEKLGDKKYSTQINRMTYEVIEQNYAIFPQKSGTVIIKPLILTADVLVHGRQSFFGTSMTKHQIVESDSITLNVQPTPTTFKESHWLSAENVELTQTWSGNFSQTKVGEPLTRTIKLVANGAMLGQLPELNNVKNDSQLKSHPAQPVLHEDKTSNGIVASREESVVFIPNKAGDYTLPEIQVSWFNTLSQKVETATLPEMNLTVADNENAPQIPATPDVVEEKQIPTTSIEPAPVIQNLISETPKNDFIWQSIAIFSTLGWLITVGFWFLKRNVTPKDISEIQESPVEISLTACVKNLKTACANNDANAAKIALLEWGKWQFNEISLGAIAPHCEARLRDEILNLNASLYAKESQIWQGKELFKTFSENNARAKLTTHAKTDALQPLYKL